MPELAELKYRGDEKHPDRDGRCRKPRPNRQDEQAPEGHVEQPTRVAVDPGLRRARIELGGQAKRYEQGKDEQETVLHAEIGDER